MRAPRRGALEQLPGTVAGLLDVGLRAFVALDGLRGYTLHPTP